MGDKLREEVGREVLGFWAEVGPIWLVGAIGLGGGDGVPWDQHVPAAEDLETAEGLAAEDILEGFAAPAPLTELSEVSRGLFRGVFAQPAQFSGSLLEGSTFLEQDRKQWGFHECGAEERS